MGWTNPKTWGVAEVVDDVTMNLHIRDNLVYLKAMADGLESDKVDRAGDTMTGRLVSPGIDLADGSAATPAIRFTSDPDTGIFLSAADALALAAGGKILYLAAEQDTQATHRWYSEDGTSYLTAVVIDANYTYLFHTSSNGASHFYIRNTTATGTLRLGAAGLDKLIIDAAGAVYPGNNGTQDLGLATNRWKGIYADILDFNDIASPGVSAADRTKVYMDQTAEKLKISEDAGAFVDIVPIGAYYASYIDPGGTGSKGSWDGYIRTGINFPFACTITNIWVGKIGGTNAVCNVYKSGVWLRSGHQTITGSADALTPLQNTAVAMNHELYPYVSSISGAVTQICFSIRFTRP